MKDIINAVVFTCKIFFTLLHSAKNLAQTGILTNRLYWISFCQQQYFINAYVSRCSFFQCLKRIQIYTHTHTHLLYWKKGSRKKRIILRMKKLHKQIVFSFFFHFNMVAFWLVAVLSLCSFSIIIDIFCLVFYLYIYIKKIYTDLAFASPILVFSIFSFIF